jgi:predicted metal-binding transcription factor (methanogenesis marker protein 9)
MGGDVVKRQKKNRGQLPKYYAENTHPAIINIETFERANAILNKRFELGRGKKPLLQGIIICDVCGKPCKLRKMDYELYWYCADRFIKGKNRCAIGRIADAKAMEITTEVLGLEAFDIDIVKDKIREIRILTPERLLYVFKDGCTEEIAWRLPLSEELSKRSLKWWADERDKAAQKQGLKESEEGGE